MLVVNQPGFSISIGICSAPPPIGWLAAHPPPTATQAVQPHTRGTSVSVMSTVNVSPLL